MSFAQHHALPLGGLLTLLGSIAMAETVTLDNGRMTYEIFEHSVEHADLPGCPEGLDEDLYFCRLTLAAERAHVFVFALDGDQPLVALRSYDLEEGLPRF